MLLPTLTEAGMLYPGMGKKPSASWKKNNTTNTGNTSQATQAAQNPQNTTNTSQGASWRKNPQESTLNSIKVALAQGVVTAAVSSPEDYNLFDLNTQRDLGGFHGNIIANLGINGGTITVNGKKTESKALVVAPIITSAGERVRYNGQLYRGKLLVTINGNNLQIINQVTLEDYVQGVLPAEMSSGWPTEALKAQAVAARTFALNTKNQGQHRGQGYDLCDGTHCQVYEGLAKESSASNAAVAATQGQILQYNGRPIYASFHASSGGATENSEDVWGNYLPYLRSVKDDDSQSPYHNWTVKFTAAQVQRLLQAAGKDIGVLQSITMEPLADHKAVTSRTASGKVYGIKLTGSTKSVVLTMEQGRKIFGLKSSLFAVRTERSVPLPTTSKPATLKKTSNQNLKDKIDTQPAAMKSDIKIKNTDSVIFDGHGFGHGLGLAQYGAKSMAEKGKKYQDILQHYYTNITLQKIY